MNVRIEQQMSSMTAYKVAIMRAAHQLVDDSRIFVDPLALTIIGDQGRSEVVSMQRKLKTRLYSHLRAVVVARSRLAEEDLSEAIKRGVRQYVILGAGLDTFAYRNPYSENELRVFEVDSPATQEWKRRLLDDAAISIPKALTFVPMDFERQSLAVQLQEAGFRTDEPSFFSWLGVTMYITGEAMMDTMKYISSSVSPGSGIVFDYTTVPSSQSMLHRLVFHLLARRVAKAGEPWKSYYDPDSLMTDLKSVGFSRAENMSPEQINARYFLGRSDKLRVGRYGHLMKALV